MINILLVVSLQFLASLYVISPFLKRKYLTRNTSVVIHCMWKYDYVVILIFEIFSMNYVFLHTEIGSIPTILFVICFLVSVIDPLLSYHKSFKLEHPSIRAHGCIASILSAILFFSTVFSIIEAACPCSFSNLNDNTPIARSVDFIYFSMATFSTVGFGDIVPVTTMARAFVSAEIVVAFAMLVIYTSFFVRKEH